MRLYLGFLATAILVATSVQASDATKQQAMEAASLYLALAGSCQTVLGSPDIFSAAVDDTLQTLVAGGYTEEEAAAATNTMAEGVAKADPLITTLDFCTDEIKAIVDGREALRAELTAAQ